MKRRARTVWGFGMVLALALVCGWFEASVRGAGECGREELPPLPGREFRAVWVATVGNIDWPTRPGLPAEAQRGEAIGILEQAQALGLNAVVLQVRTATDALYATELEPWSAVLSYALVIGAGWTLLALALGWLIFRRREVARVQV